MGRCKKLALTKEVKDGEKSYVVDVAKKTLRFMIQNEIALTPINYDEWFFIVCKAIEEHHVLSKSNLLLLYEKYFKHVPHIGDIEEIKELSYDLKHLAVDSEKALGKFASNLDSHNRYIQESIVAIDEQDVQKIQELQSKIAELEEENKKLKRFLEENRARLELIEEKFNEQKREAQHDSLTGLLNRRSFDEDMSKLDNANISYALLILDIDNFKHINDSYGHLIGDEVLKEVGEVLRKYVRKNTKTYRYGGEEFVVVLPDGDEVAAKVVAERLRKVIESRGLKLPNTPNLLTFTASFGATTKRDNETYKDVLKRADEALYEAKNRGKNRVVFK